MKLKGTPVKGFKLKDGKLAKIHAYKLDASAKIRQKKSKRVRVVKGNPS